MSAEVAIVAGTGGALGHAVAATLAVGGRTVAVGAVRQRPDRDPGGGRGAARTGRIAPPAGPVDVAVAVRIGQDNPAVRLARVYRRVMGLSRGALPTAPAGR
jgi:hypothetical protein